MKKLYILILFIFFAGELTAQVVTIPDAAFKTKLLQSSPTNEIAKNLSGNYFAIDENGDNEIQVSEAEQVSAIKIAYGNSQIHSVAGIEYFTQLSSFNCAGNYNLDSLSINGLQHLVSVVVAPNPYLTKINISNNPLLSDLKLVEPAAFSPTLESLDTLVCSNNNLDTLVLCELLDNLQIRFFDCSNNHLDSLYLGTSSALRSLNISGNDFKRLKISGINYLQYLNFQNNPLHSLIYQNSGMSDLVISDFDELRYIDVSNDQYAQRKLSSVSLSNLPVLEEFYCSNNNLTQLNLSDLPSLNHFEAKNMSLELTLHNLPAIRAINFSYYKKVNALSVSELDSLNTFRINYNDGLELNNLDIHDMNNLNILDISCSYVHGLNIDNLPVLDTLIIHGGTILSSLNIQHFPQLKYIDLIVLINEQTIQFADLPLLNYLAIGGDNINTLEIKQLPSLANFQLTYSDVVSLSLIDLPSLYELILQNDDHLGDLYLNDLPSLYNFEYFDNDGPDLYPSKIIFGNLPNLNSVTVNNINVQTLDFSGHVNLRSINLSELKYTDTLVFNDLPNFHDLYMYRSRLLTLALEDYSNLTSVRIIESNYYDTYTVLNNFILRALPNLTFLEINNNKNLLNGLIFEIENLPSLYTLKFLQYANLHMSNLPSLFNCETQSGKINSDAGMGIYISDLPNLYDLVLTGGWSKTNMDVNLIDLPNLHNFLIDFYATNVDLSSCPAVRSIIFQKSFFAIDFMNLRNGNNKLDQFSSVKTIKNICVDDDSEMELIKSLDPDLVNSNYTQTCTVTPNSHYNTIAGTINFDYDNNGCESSYISAENIKVDVDANDSHQTTFTDNEGNYRFITNVLGETLTLTPIWENPWFIFNPANATVTFSTYGNEEIIDFCATPDGVKNDVEIIMAPVSEARPGFATDYRLIFKNKGNVTSDGSIELEFNDEIIDFVSSVPTGTMQSNGSITWNYTDLLPFETKEIVVTMQLNSPNDQPPLTGGETFNFIASISTASGDETPGDNTFTLHQLVVNSFDPNDKSCLEGEIIKLDQVGNYVHYQIRFENNGSTNAENIQLRDIIDTVRFYINTLVPVCSSHDFECRIVDRNRVEFNFIGINLPYSEPDNKGYVIFKIKTSDKLEVNDQFSNTADICFDYNEPVGTNEYVTAVISADGIKDIDRIEPTILIFPNPATDRIEIAAQGEIIKVEILNVNGTTLKSFTMSRMININDLAPGLYFIKVYLSYGIVTRLFIKI